ncbi:hypothetical protein [Hoeflea poritis]|uniref:Uncharacterized protein n=1 Tax=Hoeflea poritis TaxID=2993659 RepID=A0ABT4VJ55_9HYPH|nr:hypothetical protein [Hoeflea poritis]MDA4844737.1 hypothetical protein [Hoeflea poritis]
MVADSLPDAARNLLINCAGAAPGDSILILHEDPMLGWYDLQAPKAVAIEAERQGMKPTLRMVGGPDQSGELSKDVLAAMAGHDQTVFFARIGDQGRFSIRQSGRPAVMSYAINETMLASPFGCFDYGAFLDLKDALNRTLDRAAEIRITCASGTNLRGRSIVDPDEADDVSVKRFPMGIYKPIRMQGFSGKVAVTHYLTPTGSRPYMPAWLGLDDTVIATVDGNRITGFEGAPQTVGAVENHYRHVAETFGIKPMFAHSWHSGMHPACAYTMPAADNPDRWSNTAFPNPRILHVHTCGAYPPGEICWMVFDPLVTVDGAPLWNRGQLNRQINDDIAAVFSRWPGLAALFDNPSRDIGLDNT